MLFSSLADKVQTVLNYFFNAKCQQNWSKFSSDAGYHHAILLEIAV